MDIGSKNSDTLEFLVGKELVSRSPCFARGPWIAFSENSKLCCYDT